jgi:hypothetical protein
MIRFFAAMFMGLALAGSPAAAQEYGAPLRVSAGEAYTVSMDMSETLTMRGQDINVGAAIVYRLDIVSDTPGDQRWLYTPVSFSYTDVSMLGAGIENSGVDFALLGEGVSALVRVAADIGFECRVDEYGRCLEWSNWPQWSARAENLVLMGDAFARMAFEMGRTAAVAPPSGDHGKARDGASAGEPEAEAAAQSAGANVWMEMRDPVLRSVAAFLDGIDTRSAALAMGSLHPAAAVQGRRMARGAPQTFTETWDMPFNAPPLSVAGTLVLESVDRGANSATFVRQAALDSESARASMQGVASYMIDTVLAPMQPFLSQHGADAETMTGMVEAMLPQLSVTMSETTRGVVDLQSGMARETTTDYRMVLSGPSDSADAEGTAESMEVRLNYVTRITPGAPETPRLPRG